MARLFPYGLTAAEDESGIIEKVRTYSTGDMMMIMSATITFLLRAQKNLRI